jgi:glycosyltransferase involved in cell wall biosynthesis
LTKKIKILTLGDHPLSPSGVGSQTKYVCEALLKTGKFSIISLGGAMKHQDYRPVKVAPYEDDWRIIPVDNYGTKEMIRSLLRNERPDILWIMTDPRFYGWLWEMENEIRPLCPIVYYHVWDNYPVPMFNRKFYVSNDAIATISKLTNDIVAKAAPEVERIYIPHAVDSDIFSPLTEEDILNIRVNNLPEEDRDKTIFFWNNRNARRKQSGTLVWWFKEWLDKENLHKEAQLIMHTDPKDPHGQDLEHIIEHLGLNEHRQVLLSVKKFAPLDLAAMYNMADCTINISDAEGFGLATLESMSCATPIIATVTGGLQDQILTPGKQFGIPLFPSSKSIIGSQQVPYIYEDRIDKGQFMSALTKMHQMGRKNRRALGIECREHVIENFGFNSFNSAWVDFMSKVHEELGSWDTRKGYNNIVLMEVA